MNRVFWLLLLLVIGVYGKPQPKQQVCIIGAGLSGLVSANQLSKNKIKPIVFERGNDIGGQWKYTDNTDVDEHGLPVYSGVYKNLRTNGPKVLMTIPDYQEFHGENRSYVQHETVLEYLRNYTDHFKLRQYIQLDTLVEQVSQMRDERWRVKTRNLNDDKVKVYICKAVMVCNGHYTKSYSPDIPGLETFPGRVLHSHAYRHPEEFANQTVVILGASNSGTDIGIEVSDYAKTIYLSHRNEKLTSELPKNMIQIVGVVAANGSDLILSDDSRVRADAFIICTGYLYDIPFLDNSTGIVVTKGKYVHPLYKQLININNPTMGFVGLISPGFPFLTTYFQAQYFASVLRGKVKLPSGEVMLKESQLPPGTPESKAHVLGLKVLDYDDELAKATGVEPLPDLLKPLASMQAEDAKNNLLHFKGNELFIRDGEIIFIKS